MEPLDGEVDKRRTPRIRKARRGFDLIGEEGYPRS
jgi:hypothetical protein